MDKEDELFWWRKLRKPAESDKSELNFFHIISGIAGMIASPVVMFIMLLLILTVIVEVAKFLGA